MISPWRGLAGFFAAIAAFSCLGAEPKAVLDLWPGEAPGVATTDKPESDATKATDNLVGGRRLIRLANVSKPTLSFYPAPKSKPDAPTVVVFPGGGYHILALDLEGTEVCEWLNGIGVHAVLAKYRVPRPTSGPPHVRALQDAQRAMGVVRQHAKEWGIQADRVGALGFSAGGHLVATLTASASSPRTYPTLDVADAMSCLPDFQLLIYPAYLTTKEQPDTLVPEVRVGKTTPRTFMVIAQDDSVRVENALVYYSAMQREKVPGELHIYPAGGHGYGLRRTELPVTAWADRAADWLRQQVLR